MSIKYAGFPGIPLKVARNTGTVQKNEIQPKTRTYLLLVFINVVKRNFENMKFFRFVGKIKEN